MFGKAKLNSDFINTFNLLHVLNFYVDFRMKVQHQPKGSDYSKKTAGAGIVIQVKPLLVKPAFRIGVSLGVLAAQLLIQLTTDAPGKSVKMAQVSGPLQPTGRPGWSPGSWL